MTTKIVNGGFIISKSLNKYQEALYYQKQTKNPDQGVSATLINNAIKRSTKVKLIADEVEDEKDD